MKKQEKKHRKNPAQLHWDMVEKLVQEAGPVQCVPAASTQWLSWLALSLVAMTAVVLLLHSGAEFWKELIHSGSVFFILLTLGGAALAAWGAILSSLPGRCCKTWRLPMALILVCLAVVLFFFFPLAAPIVDGCVLSEGWDFYLVFLVGLVPWTVMGFRLSRNAAFHPVITGAWSGLSAFLLATCTLYICCPCGSIGHMFISHLLPVVVGTFLCALAGAFWFSRWEKNPEATE
jgi:hypothetical protein